MEKIKNLAWQWQLLILVSISVLLLMILLMLLYNKDTSYDGVYYFFKVGKTTETVRIEEQVEQLKAKNQAARIATQRIDEFRSLFARKKEVYDELKVLLPEQREITNVLQGLQDTARGSRLIITRFSPRADTKQDFIMAKPVEVEVDSNFANLQDFFYKMAKLQRIVSITDFNLAQIREQTSKRTLHAQFILTAYYATPKSLDNLSGPQSPDGETTPAGGGKSTAYMSNSAQEYLSLLAAYPKN